MTAAVGSLKHRGKYK